MIYLFVIYFFLVPMLCVGMQGVALRADIPRVKVVWQIFVDTPCDLFICNLFFVMSSPFSRTIRSINADSFHASVAGLVIGLLILGAWCAWFFMARVSIYKVSSKVWVTGEETIVSGFSQDSRRPGETRENGIVAQFSQEDMADIKPGQEAILHLKGTGQARSVPAKVTRILKQEDKDQVELSTQLDANSRVQLKKGDTGEVKIAVDHVSPAVMVMRASGLFEDAVGISSTPEN